MHLFVTYDTVAFHHCVLGKSWLWLFLLDPAPFAFCFVFSAGWRSAYLAGGSAFRPLRFVVVVVCFFCYDLPTYMTTSVYVDVILTCFFSCKDRASERYRPHQRRKKKSKSHLPPAYLLVGSAPTTLKPPPTTLPGHTYDPQIPL